MRIRWHGQSAYTLTGAEHTVAIDPFGDMGPLVGSRLRFGYPAVPEHDAHLLLVTHEHRDHNGVEAITGDPQVVRSTAGRFETPVGEVVAIASEHDAVLPIEAAIARAGVVQAVAAATPGEGILPASADVPPDDHTLWAGRRIIEVDGQPIHDLDAFVKAVSGREDRSSLRLKTVSWNSSVEVITLKVDQRYWPTYELRRTDQGWKRASLP